MSTIVEDISSTKKRLKIEIPADILDREYSDSLNKVRQQARIPGFRQGKAPMTMIEKRYGEDIKNELLEKLVPTYYAQAVKEADLAPVTMPKFEGNIDMKKNEPLVLSLTVEVRPRIDSLNYNGIKVNDIPASVEDREVDETLKGLQNDRAIFEAVDREAGSDDLLIIDYVKLDPSGDKELSTAKDQVMNLGNRLTPPGILEGVIGKKKGDNVEITLPELAGNEQKEGPEHGNRLRITIKEVKEKKLPEIDDEFAKDFGHDSLDILREKIKEGLRSAKLDSAKKQQKSKIVDELVAGHSFDVPEALANAELDHLVMNERQSENPAIQEDAAGHKEPDSELREKLRPKALRNVKATMILDEIAEKEKITVSETEVKDRIALIARQFQATPDAVVNLFMTRDGSLDNLRHNIREEKVLDFLLSKAEIVRGE